MFLKAYGLDSLGEHLWSNCNISHSVFHLGLVIRFKNHVSYKSFETRNSHKNSAQLFIVGVVPFILTISINPVLFIPSFFFKILLVMWWVSFWCFYVHMPSFFALIHKLLIVFCCLCLPSLAPLLSSNSPSFCLHVTCLPLLHLVLSTGPFLTV